MGKASRSYTYFAQNLVSLGNICLLQGSEPKYLGSFGQSVQFQSSFHRHVTTQMRKFYLNQLLRVQTSMPIPEGKTQNIGYKALFRERICTPYLIIFSGVKSEGLFVEQDVLLRKGSCESFQHYEIGISRTREVRILKNRHPQK